MRSCPSRSSPCNWKPITWGSNIDIGWPSIDRLGLDPPDAPAEHAEAVDHRGVRVGADECVGIGSRQLRAFAHEDDAREVLEVHLVADAGVGRDDREVVKCALAPAQERVALAIALELALHVGGKSVVTREHVDLNRVVDDELGRNERVDTLRIAPELDDRVAHRSEIDDARNAREVLHQHARRRERDLLARLGGRVPFCDRRDIRRADSTVALRAQQVLEQDLQRERQSRNIEALLKRIQSEDLEAPAPDLQLGARVEAVRTHRVRLSQPARRRPVGSPR